MHGGRRLLVVVVALLALLGLAACTGSPFAGGVAGPAVASTTSSTSRTVEVLDPWLYADGRNLVDLEGHQLRVLINLQLDVVARQSDGTSALLGSGLIELKHLNGGRRGTVTLDADSTVIAYLAASRLPEPHPSTLCEPLSGILQCRIGRLLLRDEEGTGSLVIPDGGSGNLRVDTTARPTERLPDSWAPAIPPRFTTLISPDVVAFVIPELEGLCSLADGRPLVNAFVRGTFAHVEDPGPCAAVDGLQPLR